jgi:hypothetical protein
VTIPLNSWAGRSTSVILRDVLAINFPAVRDVHQLRAVLTDTPLREVHGTARTDHHRQGILINLMASDERAPSKGANISPPSRAVVPDVEDTVVHEHTAQDGPLGLEAPPSEVRHPSRSSGPEKEAVALTGPTLSWFGATMLLREKLQTLKGRAKQGPLTPGEVLELERLTAGQEAFDKLLPKLRSAQFLDLKDLPRRLRGSKELGRLNFYIPPLKGATPKDLELASKWLSHRDTKDWAALKMAGLSAAKTIARWLLPHQETSSVDHAAELRRLTRRLAQAPDRTTAAQTWSLEEARFSRLSESGSIPPGCKRFGRHWQPTIGCRHR